MKQLHLPGVVPPEHVVNVASVRHRSPFRYPGGKTWLVPRIHPWLQSLPLENRQVLIEPFAGGAIVSLSAVFEQLTPKALLIELDDQVAAVWQALITENYGDWLSERIQAFDLTQDNVNAILAQPHPSLPEQAFQTIVKNRVNRGGILAPGAGRLNRGESGRGIRSRWYPKTLAKRIDDITLIRDRLSFIHGDGLEVLRQQAHRSDLVFFIDPPYTAAGSRPGSRLYAHSDLDHSRLFRLAQELAGDFLMTYDDSAEIRELAESHGFDWRPVPMKNTHHARKYELLIGRDLHWLGA